MANLTTAVATVPQSTEVYPFLVGGGALVILFLLVLAVLAFGAGREHS
jgi:hypothetical protein